MLLLKKHFLIPKTRKSNFRRTNYFKKILYFLTIIFLAQPGTDKLTAISGNYVCHYSTVFDPMTGYRRWCSRGTDWSCIMITTWTIGLFVSHNQPVHDWHQHHCHFCCHTASKWFRIGFCLDVICYLESGSSTDLWMLSKASLLLEMLLLLPLLPSLVLSTSGSGFAQWIESEMWELEIDMWDYSKV